MASAGTHARGAARARGGRFRPRTLARTVLVLAMLHAYIGLRILPELGLGSAAGLAMVLWLVGSTAAMPLAWIARNVREQPLSDMLAWTGLVAAGSFSSLFVLTLLRDVALVAAHVVDVVAPEVLPLDELAQVTAVAVPLCTLALTLLGFVNARRRARVRPVEIAIRDLPPQLEGFSIAQISDLHVGPTIKGSYVDAVVDAVNALEADMIAITGDLVDGSVGELGAHTRPLSRLKARHGAYFVTGNHEYYSGAHAWIAELERLGIVVLLNEHVVLERDGAAMIVAGVTDYTAHHFDPSHRSDPAKALAGAPQHAAVKLLLAHQPRSAFAAVEHGFHLQLSGHTHGGQFLPWNFFVRMQQPFTAGLHRLHRLWVYVSRGTGYWGPPKRLGAPSEITHVRLVRALGESPR